MVSHNQLFFPLTQSGWKHKEARLKSEIKFMFIVVINLLWDHTNLCLQPFLWPRCTLASNSSFSEKSSDTRKKSGFSSGWFNIFSAEKTNNILLKCGKRCVVNPHARLASVS